MRVLWSQRRWFEFAHKTYQPYDHLCQESCVLIKSALCDTSQHIVNSHAESLHNKAGWEKIGFVDRVRARTRREADNKNTDKGTKERRPAYRSAAPSNTERLRNSKNHKNASLHAQQKTHCVSLIEVTRAIKRCVNLVIQMASKNCLARLPRLFPHITLILFSSCPPHDCFHLIAFTTASRDV